MASIWIVLYLSILNASATVLYDQLTNRIPSRLRGKDVPRSAFGLVRADKLNSHSSAYGIDDFLPQDIPESFRKGTGIFFYNYNSYRERDAVYERVRSFGKSLIDHITSEIFETEEERTRDLIFVGHSYGGLVIEQEVAYDALPLKDLQDDLRNAVNKTPWMVNFCERRKIQLLKYGLSCGRSFASENNQLESHPNYIKIREKLKTIIADKLEGRQRISSVPIGMVEGYTKRHSLFAAVNEKLHVHHQKVGVPHALTIYGHGGTGKIQLARKYVEEHIDQYNTILWIDAKDEDSVRSSFERCASELQLSVDRTQIQSLSRFDSPTVQVALRWLHSRKDMDEAWLAIIDDADDVLWGIKKQSQKLVDGGCEKVRVDAMELLEARMLLLRHPQLDLDLAPQDTQEDCDEIVERLGYLALAIDLAGAYMSNETDQRQAPKQYLADYSKHTETTYCRANIPAICPRTIGQCEPYGTRCSRRLKGVMRIYDQAYCSLFWPVSTRGLCKTSSGWQA
ncbi:hypothetical protein GQ43DRAFT_467880 [Delitschia confertaspora ATCC 74209]|uniref:NB-ARC domain-containing protein n=1 Tax=Delitschia confertaspora ATCC 74209 TaxID=1513339 RepID=A0A9P4MWG0_9PLEO|nr:hypothetical protein GQ43DRAFT_467880 [Delitschia confertaspora ATCC 74209]